MSDQLPPFLSVGSPSIGGIHGAAEPVFTISGLIPGSLALGGPPPVFTITGPGNESRMRALEQRCDDLQIQIARLSRS